MSAAVLALVLSGCASNPTVTPGHPTAPPSPSPAAAIITPAPLRPSHISAAGADSVAIANAGGRDLQVISTELTTYGAVTGSGSAFDATTPVWLVILSGTFPQGPCGTPSTEPHQCGPGPTTARVIVDAQTGTFMRSEMPAPSASSST